MRAIFVRELSRIARGRGFEASVVAHAALLGAFVLAWGNGGRGLPILAPVDFYGQTLLFQSSLLIVLLPWAAARANSAEARDAMVWLSALTGLQPRRLVLARTTASWLALSVVIAAGLPVVLLAGQVSAPTVATILRDEFSMLGLAAIAACAVHVFRFLQRPLSAWLAATAATASIWLAIGAHAASPAILGLVVAVAALLLAAALPRADSSLHYLSEPSS